jgi:hypothetical protein
MVAKGEYVVKEDGLQFDHSTMVEDDITSNDDYLHHFWYVLWILFLFLEVE